jgi:hypothetical protein
VSSKVKEAFVEEIMEVVELTPIRNSIVGLPGVLGLTRFAWLPAQLRLCCRQCCKHTSQALFKHRLSLRLLSRLCIAHQACTV